MHTMFPSSYQTTFQTVIGTHCMKHWKQDCDTRYATVLSYTLHKCMLRQANFMILGAIEIEAVQLIPNIKHCLLSVQKPIDKTILRKRIILRIVVKRNVCTG